MEETHPVNSRIKTVLPFIFGLFLIFAAAAGGYLLRMKTHPVLKIQVNAAPLPGNISATTTDEIRKITINAEVTSPIADKNLVQTPILRDNPAQAPQTLGKNIYSSSAMNLSIQIPDEWQLDTARSNDKRLVFTSGALGQTTVIERYEGVTDSLENIEITLKNSPSVFNTQQIMVLGKPAIAFTGGNVSQNGIAVLNKNNLYYFYSQTATSSFLQNMSFIN